MFADEDVRGAAVARDARMAIKKKCSERAIICWIVIRRCKEC